MSLQFIYDILYILCPLRGCLRLVERLPGNGFPDGYGKGLVSVFQHFVGQIQHGDVELDSQELAQVCQVVEKVGVASLEVDGDDVALMFYAFYDECLFPIQIGYHSAFLTAGTKAGGEHDELIV